MNQSGATQDRPVGNVVPASGDKQRTATIPSNALAITGVITSQVALITALLYYFGWVYVHGFFGYFGVDSSLVDYSTIDYLLHSINLTFKPFIILGVSAFVLFSFHRLTMVPALVQVARDSPPPSNAVGGDGRPATPHGVHPWVSWVLTRWRLGLSGVRWIIGALQVVASSLAVIVVAVVLFSEQIGARLGLLLSIFLILAASFLGYIEYLHLRHTEALAAAKIQRATPPSQAYILALFDGRHSSRDLGGESLRRGGWRSIRC